MSVARFPGPGTRLRAAVGDDSSRDHDDPRTRERERPFRPVTVSCGGNPFGGVRPVAGPGAIQPNRRRGSGHESGRVEDARGLGGQVREGLVVPTGASPRAAKGRTTPGSRPHWSRVWTTEGAEEAGRGTRPEQVGPEQGSGRPGMPDRSCPSMARLPPVMSGSRWAADQAPRISTPKGWSHPARAGRGVSPPGPGAA